MQPVEAGRPQCSVSPTPCQHLNNPVSVRLPISALQSLLASRPGRLAVLLARNSLRHPWDPSPTPHPVAFALPLPFPVPGVLHPTRGETMPRRDSSALLFGSYSRRPENPSSGI